MTRPRPFPFSISEGTGDESDDKAPLSSSQSHWDRERYDSVVKQCCLDTDFDAWPARDETFLGEKGTCLAQRENHTDCCPSSFHDPANAFSIKTSGITISGGQKQRIALARLLYSDAKILLLDSPLSGLDEIVTHHVFHSAVLAAARERLVVMAGHRHELLPYADRIVAMEGGRIIFDGSHSEYSVSQLPLDSEKIEDSQRIAVGAATKPKIFGENGSKGDTSKSEKDSRLPSKTKENVIKHSAAAMSRKETEDNRTIVSNTWDAHVDYIKRCGYGNIAFAIGVTIAAYSSAAFGDYLLSYWTNGEKILPLPLNPSKFLPLP